MDMFLTLSKKSSKGIDLYTLLKHEDSKFWEYHALFQKRSVDFFDEDFKKLFSSMIKNDYSKRITIEEVKRSKWYNGPVYTNEEVAEVMKAQYPLA